ncbi:MAG TPA: hypothetical protein VIJ83_04095 [Solirubrobacteraceae bacterium]
MARDGEPARCQRCYREVQPRRRCGRCGKTKMIGRRARDGEPDICVDCVPQRQAPCGICGRVGPLAVKATEDSPAIGRCCYRSPPARCHVCGKERPCYHAGGPEPICPSCASARRSSVCLDCGRERRPELRVEGGVLCQRCAWRRERACGRCGSTAHLNGSLCGRCRLATRLARIAASGDDAAVRQLGPYLAALLETPNPDSTHRWTWTPTFGLVREMLAGRLEISHAALDARAEADGPPSPRAVAFLRAALVDAGVLARRDDPVRTFEEWLDRTLALLPEGRDRALVEAYARWEVAPRLSGPPAFRRARPRSRQKHPRSLVARAVELAVWLRGQGLGLADLRQDRLDAWIAAGNTTRRQARLFVAWLERSGAAPPLRVEWPDRGPSPGPLEEESRLATLRALLHGEDAAAPERLAGCLLLLFGQPLTRTAALRATDVAGDGEGGATISLGHGGVALPNPLVKPALDLRDAALRRGGGEAWLLPGRTAGTHLSAETLGNRLRRRHGVTAKAARQAALLELASRLPAPILAERFGLHQGRAAGWVREAGRTYADYAALRVGAGQAP